METKTLHVEAGSGYDIIIEPGVLDRAGEHIKNVLVRAKKLFVLTDSNVGPIYGPRLVASLETRGFMVRTHVIPAGETSKCAASLLELWSAMASFGITRSDAVVALGGGVVGDLAGLAASTILRGVDLVQIPTTLLSQVDSSVGGKTAIDLPEGKNLVGTFYQPKLVLMDPEVLSTLPDADFMSGMAEVVKYGCIWDAEFFRFLASRPTRDSLMAGITHILYTCCDIKRQVVNADEHDTGLRMILNFGHTLGHAYELAGDYRVWTHGQAVAAGMVAISRLGERLSVTEPGTAEKIASVLAPLGLPTNIECDLEHMERAIGVDKKSSGDSVTLILLEKLGTVRPLRLPKADVADLLRDMPGWRP